MPVMKGLFAASTSSKLPASAASFTLTPSTIVHQKSDSELFIVI
jgi:hypothetical protein